MDVLGHELPPGSLARLIRPRDVMSRGATHWRARKADVPAGRGPRVPRPGWFRRDSCAGMSRNACGWLGSACRRAGPVQDACAGLNTTRSPPCMRCRGPCLASPHRPTSCLGLLCRAPPARVRNPREAQVSLLLPRPGVASGQCPFLTVNVFLLPRRGIAQALNRIIFWFFRCPHSYPQNVTGYPHSASVFPPSYAQSVHRLPGVTRGTPRSPGRPPKSPQEKFRRCQIQFPAVAVRVSGIAPAISVSVGRSQFRNAGEPRAQIMAGSGAHGDSDA